MSQNGEFSSSSQKTHQKTGDMVLLFSICVLAVRFKNCILNHVELRSFVRAGSQAQVISQPTEPASCVKGFEEKNEKWQFGNHHRLMF